MRILISGAGIAGPALAWWLRTAGIETLTVDTVAGVRPGGQTVDIRGAARTVVERMGILPDIRRHRSAERGIAGVDARGRRRWEMPAGLFGGEGIIAELEIPRSDLVRILHAGAGPVVQDRITALTQDRRGVGVTFASGHSDRFDIVVGADGVHSGVRALAFGPEDRFVRHLGAGTAWFTMPDPGGLDGWFLMHNAPGGRVAGLRPGPGGTAMASLTFRSGPVRYDRGTVVPLLAERFAGVGWRVPELLAAAQQAEDLYVDAVCQVRAEPWSHGRIVLLGDAGYCGSPLTGLGTSMALVGAYVLAGRIAADPADPVAALQAYRRILQDYVSAGLRLPPGGVRAFAPRSRIMIGLRGASMRMMTRRPWRGLMDAQAAKAGAITLPDPPPTPPAGAPATGSHPGPHPDSTQ
ncbi:FAD-dependent monooxygenase [Actinoplanes sp. N902-109]|uniref:FAD-dependent monooxygenase n=1 Tax=Actinoplanes sp. (strain N902-109) TaxID=649831 RepID=UPI000329351A|nr:FAD-dependent monooxygenase [Actinoplanes sp. N902-109]AGL18188.1 putative monooxygenase [Actinoplanes sp. N902-109]